MTKIRQFVEIRELEFVEFGEQGKRLNGWVGYRIHNLGLRTPRLVDWVTRPTIPSYHLPTLYITLPSLTLSHSLSFAISLTPACPLPLTIPLFFYTSSFYNIENRHLIFTLSMSNDPSRITANTSQSLHPRLDMVAPPSDSPITLIQLPPPTPSSNPLFRFHAGNSTTHATI
jgi:hypothetical protein